MMQAVTITQQEYDNLVAAKKTLNALYSAGVDNWEGYSIAMDAME